ncbi:MAG TPA: AGE family epimerase/isomerase [Anaeromyxobacteraceae bacterium]|nr:AGE family epimerase/isomerase [Anaeromyxobacteraceae bacterium]
MTSSRTRSPLLALALLALVSCPATPPAPASPPGDPYAYTPPPAGAVPAGLDAATWQAHLESDLLPYWTMAAAQGTPVGNFPTYRGMDGSVQGSTSRKPRMMGRQIFTYCIGYLLTGDEALLDLARAGDRWLLDHARDTARGGWYADLDQAGNPLGDGSKFAQDMAYDAMGPAAWLYVTADPEAESAVLATRDLLFDPARYWDSTNGRIKDGMDGALAVETYMSPGGAGSWQLVAQLDPATAFLLLVQPVLTDPARREQALGDLRTLALRIRDSFWRDGIFWGATGTIGQYGSNHTDFGHILKAYWALLQIDKRLPDRPLQGFLSGNAPATLTLAHDSAYGRWAKLPLSPTAVGYGSDWWAYAEADQLAATLALHDPGWVPVLADTAAHFRADYVDRTRPAREVVPSVSRDGSWVYPWPDTDTAKCNEWKSGFHAAEHALVLYLFGHWLAGTPAPLYFALPAGDVASLAARRLPYTFPGRAAAVEDLGPLTGDPTRHKVRVSFDELR